MCRLRAYNLNIFSRMVQIHSKQREIKTFCRSSRLYLVWILLILALRIEYLINESLFSQHTEHCNSL